MGDNILVRSETGENPTRTGRYTLSDEGSDFTVTIADLRLSDSGTYICAVDRFLKDTYNYVTLHVTEGKLCTECVSEVILASFMRRCFISAV